MAVKTIFNAILLSIVYSSLNVVRAQSNDCTSCNPDACLPEPVNCPAGLVTDGCGCCNVCGKTEGQRCDHPDLPASVTGNAGKCGQHLECRLRDDVGVPVEAVCRCRFVGVVCGSDGVTYDSGCNLMEKAIEKQIKINVQSMGPCQSAPIITSPPENIKNSTGGTVTLACEASGFPIPAIDWTWTRVDGKINYLPSDDQRISVNTRGGPERWQATSFLQIWELGKQHEGDYTCYAVNVNGTTSARARVNVVNAPLSIDDTVPIAETFAKKFAGAQETIKERIATDFS